MEPMYHFLPLSSIFFDHTSDVTGVIKRWLRRLKKHLEFALNFARTSEAHIITIQEFKHWPHKHPLFQRRTVCGTSTRIQWNNLHTCRVVPLISPSSSPTVYSLLEISTFRSLIDIYSLKFTMKRYEKLTLYLRQLIANICEDSDAGKFASKPTLELKLCLWTRVIPKPYTWIKANYYLTKAFVYLIKETKTV